MRGKKNSDDYFIFCRCVGYNSVSCLVSSGVMQCRWGARAVLAARGWPSQHEKLIDLPGKENVVEVRGMVV